MDVKLINCQLCVLYMFSYASEDVCSLRAQDPNSQPSFFVIYDMVNAEVIKVFDGASDDLLTLYENFCDLLRYPAAVSDGDITSWFASSPSTNVHARQAHERFKYSITGARYGGRTEAVRRVLAQLPISAQSYSTSPFLDLSLFSYDDKWVSAMERPKACGDHPIRYLCYNICIIHCVSKKGTPTLSIVTLKRINGF